MRKTLTLLLASTALTAAIGIPAWSAMRRSVDGSLWSRPALLEESALAGPLVLVGGDEQNEKQRARKSSQHGHDDGDEEDEDDDEDEDEDEDGNRNGAGNPAPAGSVAPPQNGLFGNGAAPRAQVN